ncbi:MAG: phytanoyl-CoA dioxygenase family protein [Proteobacteria bacterium]|nr:phytanoyl-CoA dioxygenase family protein [Pseudomonadota bacterium]
MTPCQSPHETYVEKGFYLHPEPIVSGSLLRLAIERISALMNGTYDMGAKPWRRWNIGHPYKMQKIDQVHLCDRAFYSLVTQPVIGEWIARVSSADLVQVWATQLLVKPPGGGKLGAVGWHMDRKDWPFWQGEILTMWLALDDVRPDCGPLLYVQGSHRWPDIAAPGDAYIQDLEAQEKRLKQLAPHLAWREVPALLRAGGAGFHSADTLHGSRANRTDCPRIGLAISVRTERSRVKSGVEDYGYTSYLDHPSIAPIIYRRERIDP